MELKYHSLGVEARKHIHSWLIVFCVKLRGGKCANEGMKGRDAGETTQSVKCSPQKQEALRSDPQHKDTKLSMVEYFCVSLEINGQPA